MAEWLGPYLHLSRGDKRAEYAKETEELVGLVDLNWVLQSHMTDTTEKRTSQRQHISDHPTFACKETRKYALYMW